MISNKRIIEAPFFRMAAAGILGGAFGLGAGIAAAATVTAPEPAAVRAIAGSALAAKPAAAASLTQLANMATVNYRLLGFASANEAKSSSVGAPILIYDVPLDKLRGFSGPGDPAGLLSGGDRLLYPVLSKQQLRSSVTVAKINGAWKATAYGRPAYAAAIFGARSKDAVQAGVSDNGYIEVTVPALNVEFLGRGSDGGLVLIPTRDYLGLGFRAGMAYPEKDVFARLVEAARIGNNGPYN